MSFLIFGAGAIGTYVGGSLLLAKQRVVFLERPEVAAQVRRNGLHLDLSGVQHHLPEPQVCDSLVEALNLGLFRCSRPGFEILRYTHLSVWFGRS